MHPDTEKADPSLNTTPAPIGDKRRAAYRRRNTPELIRLKKRITSAVQLRLAGLSYQAIGDALESQGLGSCSTTSAYELVQRGMAVYDHELAQSREMLRNLENVRLDRLQAAWWPEAVGGKVDGKEVQKSEQGARIVNKLIMDRAKLNGLVADGSGNGGGQTNVNIFIAQSQRVRSVFSRLSSALRSAGEMGLALEVPPEPENPTG